jgi:hypothetical protein
VLVHRGIMTGLIQSGKGRIPWGSLSNGMAWILPLEAV